VVKREPGISILIRQPGKFVQPFTPGLLCLRETRFCEPTPAASFVKNMFPFPTFVPNATDTSRTQTTKLYDE
jgi:hypothetical protein